MIVSRLTITILYPRAVQQECSAVFERIRCSEKQGWTIWQTLCQVFCCHPELAVG